MNIVLIYNIHRNNNKKKLNEFPMSQGQSPNATRVLNFSDGWEGGRGRSKTSH